MTTPWQDSLYKLHLLVRIIQLVLILQDDDGRAGLDAAEVWLVFVWFVRRAGI
jgi:hypothetical protein